MTLTRAQHSSLKALKKRRKYFRLKRRYAVAFERAGYHDLAQELRDCQETESLVVCGSCSSHFWVLTRCRSRICPLCAYDVARERQRYITLLSQSMAHPKLITLTLPPSDLSPREEISYLRKSFGKLRRTKLFSSVKGGAYNIEVKPNNGHLHVHMHALLDAPYIPYKKLFAEWRRIVGSACPQVDIRSASDPKAREYVAKYATKAVSYNTSDADIVAWYTATKGIRLWATFGTWYNADLDELDPDKPQDPGPPPCPNCGETGALFFARDGPYVLGHEAWEAFESVLPVDASLPRPIPHVQQYLDDPTSFKQETAQ